ncbi:SLATT domain-containing protein [Glycomyces tarimensis]
MSTTEGIHERAALLRMSHHLRVTEHHLRVAQSRRRWSNISLVFGPVMIILLYTMWWIPVISETVKIAVTIPIIPVVLGFSIASFRLKRSPGGPVVYPSGKDDRDGWQVFFDALFGNRSRTSEGDLELQVSQIREERKQQLADASIDISIRRTAYKEDAYSDIDELRTESKRYRSINNTLQGVVIIGSLAATGTAGIAAQFSIVRWALLGMTFLVGISSGFMGYFKYKERSFYLQQTADAIEQEWEAVEVGVGRYKRFATEAERLEEFVEEVHRLKSEQKKRQQNLEQPPELRNSAE